jgi:hypothetical protein
MFQQLVALTFIFQMILQYVIYITKCNVLEHVSTYKINITYVDKMYHLQKKKKHVAKRELPIAHSHTDFRRTVYSTYKSEDWQHTRT